MSNIEDPEPSDAMTVSGERDRTMHVAMFWSDNANYVLVINDVEVHGAFQQSVRYRAAAMDVPASSILAAICDAAPVD